MSAFIVSHDHIDALLTYAIQNQISFWNPEEKTRTTIMRDNAEEIGRILLQENETSVRYRYNDFDTDDLPGTVGETAATYAYRPFFSFPRALTAVGVLKAVQCLEYQSCEHPEWEASLAWRICQDLKSSAIHDLPNYDRAEWEINRPQEKTDGHAA